MQKLLEFLDPAFNRVSIDEVLLADLRVDGDAGEVPLFAIPLDGSDGAGDSSIGKDHRCFFGRQRMSRLVAFCRVIARRAIYGVVHTYSKRTTQIGWGNDGYPHFGVGRISKGTSLDTKLWRKTARARASGNAGLTIFERVRVNALARPLLNRR